MENFVSNYILGFCDYLDKTGDYEFADRIMSKIANPLQENVRIASKDLYTPDEVVQKFINYRLAEDSVSPAIIDSIEKFVAMGYPVLVGASRKRFLGGDSPDEREQATIELTKRLGTTGVWAVRVHSVKPHKEVLSS